MNVSQANHPLQQASTNDAAQVVSGMTTSEAFLNQLHLAQQGDEWYTRTDVKTEKERVYEEQQNRRRESEDLEDDLIAGMASQGYVNDLKQSEAMESARVVAAAENRDRLAQHVEKKHLHTPTIVEDGNSDGTENGFSKVMAGELEGAAKGMPKDQAGKMTSMDGDESNRLQQALRGKTAEPAAVDTAQRYDAALVNGARQEPAAKTALRFADANRSALSRLDTAEGTGAKTATRSASAKVMSLSGLSSTSPEGRKTEAEMKASQPNKPQAPVNIKDVVGTVKIMISSKTNEMVMKLAPEHLGKLEIRLKKEGEKLLGRFKVDSRQAKEAIEVQLPQLRESLAEQGIHLGEIAVLVNGEESSNQSFAFNQGQDGESGFSQSAAETEGGATAVNQVSEATTGSASGANSGLNIYA